MHLGDSVFILILALVMLGPKKTSELAGQLGKLMAEFRKASNDFKYQFNEEMRVSEQQEQQKKREAERAGLESGAATGTAMTAALSAGENSILPPAVQPRLAETSEAVPYAVSAPVTDDSANLSGPVSAISATTGEEQPVEDHPLLQVREIPPMPIAAVAEPLSAPVPEANGHHEGAAFAEPMREQDGAPVQHG